MNVQCLLSICFQNQSYYIVSKLSSVVYCQLCADYCVDLMIPLHVMLVGALFQLEGPLVSHVYHAVLPCCLKLGKAFLHAYCVVLTAKAPTSRNTYLQKERQNFGALKTRSHCVFSNIVGCPSVTSC